MGKVWISPKNVDVATASEAEYVSITGPASPLFEQEDPLVEREKEIVYVDRPVDRIVEVIKEVPVEVIREVKIIEEKIVEVIREIPGESRIETITKEVIKEVPVEIIKFIDRLDVRFKLPTWAIVTLAAQTAIILALLFK